MGYNHVYSLMLCTHAVDAALRQVAASQYNLSGCGFVRIVLQVPDAAKFLGMLRACSRSLHFCSYRQTQLHRMFLWDDRILERLHVSPSAVAAAQRQWVCYSLDLGGFETIPMARSIDGRLYIMSGKVCMHVPPSSMQATQGSCMVHNVQACRRLSFRVSLRTTVTFETYREGLTLDARMRSSPLFRVVVHHNIDAQMDIAGTRAHLDTALSWMMMHHRP